MKKICLFGGGGHAKVLADLITCVGGYQIEGYFASEASNSFRCPYLGDDAQFSNSSCEMGVIAIADNSTRKKLAAQILKSKPHFQFATLIHPRACVALDVQLGEGSVVFAGSVINAGTSVGSHCIVNTNASLDHDNRLSDFSSVAPGVVTGGSVSLGALTALCLGVKVVHGVNVGEETVVGAGSLVLEDLPLQVLAYGSPCQVIRKREANEPYL